MMHDDDYAVSNLAGAVGGGGKVLGGYEVPDFDGETEGNNCLVFSLDP